MNTKEKSHSNITLLRESTAITTTTTTTRKTTKQATKIREFKVNDDGGRVTCILTCVKSLGKLKYNTQEP